ncbi:3'-5' exonuclease [Acerihabitans sp. KWT182]|uniref:3'-5' exonuclease n=1 Tax=Acerihabitans sp. KWT182 TaxID=3157919 RepID=A0AAU7QD64_9GAMM
MINNITIDIETLDTKPSAVILSIGAFAFDITNVTETQALIITAAQEDRPIYTPRAFYGLIDTFDQLMRCRSVTRETQQWWYKQGAGARAALEGERQTLADQLLNLSSWIAQHREARIFFRGTDFDGSILEHAYRMCGMECPWSYNGKRDVRTYIDAMTHSMRGYLKDHQPCFSVVKHHALHDAMSDAEQMAVAYQLNSKEVAA